MGTQMRSAGRHLLRAGSNRPLTIRTSRHDRRSAGLDGVRGLAALSVFVFHIWLYGAKGSKSNLSAQVFNEFRIGLICFFVLSGYLLYGAFARAARRQAGEVPMRRYLLRRGARILPAYYVSLIGSLVLLEAVAGSPDVRLPDEGGFTLFFFFAQNYSGSTIMKLNPVTWTLCLEVAFYVLLPVLGAFAYHLAKGRRGPQVALLGGLVALGLAWNVVGYLDAWNQPATKALPAYLPYFAAGMLLSLLDRGPARGWARAAPGRLVDGGGDARRCRARAGQRLVARDVARPRARSAARRAARPARGHRVRPR